jgi:hypothetical protein
MRWWLTIFLACGCESGLSETAKVTLPAALAQAFTAAAPGLVVSDLGGSVAPYVPLCGQTPQNPLELSRDLGFGCLGSLKGTHQTVHVWVQPLPAGWDAGTACAPLPTRSFSPPLSLAPAPPLTDGGVDAGTSPGLPSAADPSWPQGSADGTWTPIAIEACGGALDVEITLAAP